MAPTVLVRPTIPRGLDIARTVVAIPGFYEAGHTTEELPHAALLDQDRAALPFDIRAYPHVYESVAALKGRAVGIWTTDSIQYASPDAASLMGWLDVRYPTWEWLPGGVRDHNFRRKQEAYWKMAKPEGILERHIGANILTDYGAKLMLGLIAAAATGQFFNRLQLSADAKVAQVSGATANLSAGISSGVTAIPVVTGGTAFANGNTIVIGAGTANAETRIVSGTPTNTNINVTAATSNNHNINDIVALGVATGATAIPVVSGGAAFTSTMQITASYGAIAAYAESPINVGSGSTGTSIVTAATAKVHASGDWIVQNPGTQANNAVDNPSSLTNPYDSGALAAAAFNGGTGPTGTGPGNRQVQVVFNFPANAGAPAGGYTDLWTASANPVVANTTASHQTRSPLLVNGTTGANVTYTDTM